jgi:hypothetical protein
MPVRELGRCRLPLIVVERIVCMVHAAESAPSKPAFAA